MVSHPCEPRCELSRGVGADPVFVRDIRELRISVILALIDGHAHRLGYHVTRKLCITVSIRTLGASGDFANPENIA